MTCMLRCTSQQLVIIAAVLLLVDICLALNVSDKFLVKPSFLSEKRQHLLDNTVCWCNSDVIMSLVAVRGR